jgi:hypothetical protein
MEISWADRVKYEILHRVKEEKISYIQVANWIDHILRRNCLLKHVVKERWKDRSDEKIERRSKQLLDDRKETSGYWKLKKEALDRTVWRTRFGKGNGPVVRQSA